MRLPGATLLLALIAALPGCSSRNPKLDFRTEILGLEQRRQEAQLRGDWAAIQQMDAPDFIDIGANGVIRTGAENGEAMRSGKLKFDTVNFSEQQVRSYGDVAIVTGIARRTGSFDGTPFQHHIRYTRIYVHGPAGWKVVEAQNTLIEE